MNPGPGLGDDGARAPGLRSGRDVLPTRACRERRKRRKRADFGMRVMQGRTRPISR